MRLFVLTASKDVVDTMQSVFFLLVHLACL
jgi:hypothetical protein